MAQAARLVSRLQRELKMLQSDPPPGVSAWPCDGHILTHLQAQIHGPEGTVYANGIFKLDIQLPDRYPFEPPTIKFVTPVYHPNIDNGGRICLDILNLPPKGAWRPSLNLPTLLASIGLLLAEPNPDDGLMGDITAEYKHDRASFDAKARNWTELYANQDQVTPETLTNAEPDHKVGTGGVHGQERMQVRSFGDHMISSCTTSSQPLRSSLSLSKRLTLDRGTACLQDTKAATSSVSSQGKVKHTDSVNQIVSSSQSHSEETNLHTKVEAQSSKVLAIKEKQFIGDIAFVKYSSSSSIAEKKRLSHREEKLSISCNELRGDIYDVMAANTALSNAASMERSPGGGKGAQQPSVPKCAKVFDVEKSNGRSVQSSGQKSKDIAIVGKENQPPKHGPVAKPKEGSFKHLAADEGLLAEVRPMEVSSSIDLSCSRGVKDRGNLCLPSRTKSLKLTRAKPDSNSPHATTTMQQTIAAEKQQTIPAEKSPIVIPDDVPTVVVSDSGSDCELSDEGFALSLTQRNLHNKRKASSKLR